MKYFNESEFNRFEKMNNDFLKDLDHCRELAGIPFKITSSYRDPEHNKRVGGSKNSYHLKGRAVDIQCNNGIDRIKIIRSALGIGLTIGVHKNFIHLDNRSKQIVFAY